MSAPAPSELEAFRTQRLRVRRWRDDDLEALHAVYGDAAAMRFVGEGRAITREECERWQGITAAQYAKRGYGMLAVEGPGVLGVIGFCGLVHPGGQELPELKYAYGRAHWGQGYATEAAAGLLRYAAQTLGLPAVMATVAPAHTVSQRVLLKAGMVQGRMRENPDGSQTCLFHWPACPV